MTTFIPQEIIRKKRDGHTLTQDEIAFFVQSIVDGKFTDSQVSSMAMAIFFQGLTQEESSLLTQNMCQSGHVMSWPELDKPTVDKHSTGGVGDKVSFILGPLLAACDVYVPMLAGRGLGHTGGTVDKLEAIPGYNVSPGLDKFRQVVSQVGCAIIGQTADIAPADKRFYAIRDITATVESIHLITASILSKKLAEGIDALVMDVKFGNGAFASTFEQAQQLARSLQNVGQGAGLKIKALLTDMNQVLGSTIGNALEIEESVNFLKGVNQDPRLYEVTFRLCEEALILTGVCQSHNQARLKLEKALRSGKAVEIFEKMLVALGGPHDFVENMTKYLPQAKLIHPVYPQKSGYLTAVNAREMGLALIKLGGGRQKVSDKINLAVGFSDFVNIGEFVDHSKPIAIIHADSEKELQNATESILQYCDINDNKMKNDISEDVHDFS